LSGRLVVIAPLKRGAVERARQLLEDGPPFDLERTRFDAHEVFITEQEVVFLFEGPADSLTLEFPGEDPALWKAAAAWAECLAGRPRIARTAFAWRRIETPEGVTFAPTPGPGDSEGGDLYSP
jgi:hypothetical protein